MPLLESHVGKPVCFKAPVSLRPSGAPERRGRIVAEIWADEAQRNPVVHDHEDPHCWGDYAFCSQLIQWENGEHTIRLTYYRLPCRGSRWQFAGQTAIETYPYTVKALMENTLKSGWFEEPPSL